MLATMVGLFEEAKDDGGSSFSEEVV